MMHYPGRKVGGIGDVVRDIPPALADEGHQINIITPGNGAFSLLPGAEFQNSVQVLFAGKRETIGLFTVVGKNPHEGVVIWVLEHHLFASGDTGSIYCDDPEKSPFATDASKLSLLDILGEDGIF